MFSVQSSSWLIIILYSGFPQDAPQDIEVPGQLDYDPSSAGGKDAKDKVS